MYNPEKQARAAGGKFGGKVAEVVEEVEAAGEKVMEPVADRVVDLYDSYDEYLPTGAQIGNAAAAKAKVATALFFAAAGIVIVALLRSCVG